MLRESLEIKEKARDDWEEYHHTTESVSAAAGGEEGTGFIFGEGRAWSEASWPGAEPVL